jgi:zinc protease
MQNKILVLVFLFISLETFSFDQVIKKESWNGLEVVWVKDERLPTYDVVIYFADGALADADQSGVKGSTDMMFDLLSSGTKTSSEKEIMDFLEFYGTGIGSSVNHEYSIVRYSGLSKDIILTTKKVCELFRESTFPEAPLNRHRAQLIDAKRNAINDPADIASRVFREISLQGTPYSYPVDGKMADIKKMNAEALNHQLNYFNKSVQKRIYITGPASVLGIKDVIQDECKWNGSSRFKRDVKVAETNSNSAKATRPKIYLVKNNEANQGQIRIGKTLSREEINNPYLLDLNGEFLGGGFTSLLMHEVRTKRGLTYNVSASLSGQKQYGRAVISTFSKSETVAKTIEVIHQTLDKVKNEDFAPDTLERVKLQFAGSHPFGFESMSAFLGQLLYIDHVERDYLEIYEFPKRVAQINQKDLVKFSSGVWDWNHLTILVVGSEKLATSLKEIGEVEIISADSFL